MQVGQFTLTTSDNGNISIAGPKAYMEEQGNARIEKIEAGECVVFRASLQHSPNIGTAVLVSLQTDYAAWKGLQPFKRSV